MRTWPLQTGGFDLCETLCFHGVTPCNQLQYERSGFFRHEVAAYPSPTATPWEYETHIQNSVL